MKINENKTTRNLNINQLGIKNKHKIKLSKNRQMYLLSPTKESSRPNTVQSELANIQAKDYNSILLNKIRKLNDKNSNKNNSTQTIDTN